MKRLVVLASALALAACGSGEDETATAAATPSTSRSSVPASLAGTYGASGADGQPWTTVLDTSGTYRNTVAGDLTESGTWAQTGDQLCFTPTPAAGETAEQTCQILVNVNDDGSLVMRDTAGEETTAPRLPSQE